MSRLLPRLPEEARPWGPRFNLAVLHAVVLERTVYAPVGWSKPYEFGDADLLCALEILDTLMDEASKNGAASNVSPDKIPWTQMGQMIYHVASAGWQQLGR